MLSSSSPPILSHARSDSHPESINLSLLSFSGSLSTLPSLASESIVASLPSVSFPDNIPKPKDTPATSLVPLGHNLLLLAPPPAPPADSELSSNQCSQLTRITLAAPTLLRLKGISKEPTCVAKWVKGLANGADAPGHVPWGGNKIVRPLEWIPEGSLYPPAIYSKARLRMRQRHEINASRGVVTPPQSTLNVECDAVSAQTFPTTKAGKRDHKRSNQRDEVELHLSASNPSRPDKSTPVPTRSQDISKPLNTSRKRPSSPQEERRKVTTKIPHSTRYIAALREKERASQKRRSIATLDMINSLRVQCAALTINTPPTDQSHQNTIPDPASIPMAAEKQDPRTDSSTDVDYPSSSLTTNDSRSRPSIPYRDTTVSSRVKACQKPPLARVQRLRDGALAATRISSISTSSSDETESTLRPGSRIHRRRNVSQMFRPSKSHFGNARSSSNRTMSLPRKGPLIFLTVKRVRFAPPPTTVMRYPPEYSEHTDDECSQYYGSQPQPSQADYPPSPRSPWLREMPRASSLRAASTTHSRSPKHVVPSQPSLQSIPPAFSSSNSLPVVRSKNSFTRRSLSRIMKIDRPISFGLPTIQSAWSLDENKARREDDASSTRTTRSRIPLPRLRLGNLFSRFT